MARRPRLLIPGAVYHVMSRGNRKGPIFDDDDDRGRFLDLVADTKRRFDVRYYAFCLMSNHYHLVCVTPHGNLSRAMKRVNGVYTQASNRNHGRTGHLLEGRFKSIVVETETYLRRLARYVVLNPVRAGLVEDAASWTWSSYRATAGLEPPPDFLDISWLDWVFGGSREEAQLKYRQFVGETSVDEADVALDSLMLGSKALASALRDIVQADQTSRRLPRAHRALARPALRELFGIPNQARSVRNELIREAHMRYGYTLREIGAFLGLHPNTPSAILRYLERASRR